MKGEPGALRTRTMAGRASTWVRISIGERRAPRGCGLRDPDRERRLLVGFRRRDLHRDRCQLGRGSCRVLDDARASRAWARQQANTGRPRCAGGPGGTRAGIQASPLQTTGGLTSRRIDR